MKYSWLKTALGASIAVVLSSSMVACGPTGAGTTPETTPNSEASSAPNSENSSSDGGSSTDAGNSNSSSGSGTAAEDSNAGSSSWAMYTGNLPCTDKSSMWWDDDTTGFIGCGRRGDAGLYTTTDGENWDLQKKVNVKVNGFMRGADGKMYMAGQFGGPAAVLDESNPRLMSYEVLYQRGNSAFTSVEQGESIGVTSDGQILVDSLTGTNAAYHAGSNATGKAWHENTCTGEDKSTYNPDSSNTWCELHGVNEDILDGSSIEYQITEIKVVNDKFYAAGRYIADEGKVRLPSKKEGATYHMATVSVQSKGKGEMMDMEVWPNGQIIAIGTDQSSGRFAPLLYKCDAGADCYEQSSWKDIVPDFMYDYDDASFDGRSISASGDTVVAIGNFVPNARGGWAMMSKDGGQNWTDLTPELKKLNPDKDKVDNLYNVQVFESGKILILGEDSYVYTP